MDDKNATLYNLSKEIEDTDSGDNYIQGMTEYAERRDKSRKGKSTNKKNKKEKPEAEYKPETRGKGKKLTFKREKDGSLSDNSYKYIAKTYKKFSESGGAEKSPNQIDFSFEDPNGVVITLNPIINNLLNPNIHGSLNNSRKSALPGTDSNNPYKNAHDENESNKFMRAGKKDLYLQLTMNGLLFKNKPDKFIYEGIVKTVPNAFEFLIETLNIKKPE